MLQKIFIIVIPFFLYAQNNDSLKIDSLQLFYSDLLEMQMQFDKRIRSGNIYNPKLPNNPFEIDNRSSSYYTPRKVSDILDQHMNRPRSDNFIPILPVAYIAASIAAQQLEINKMFEPDGKDYLVSDRQWQVLSDLWQKSPLRIDQLYHKSEYSDSLTANILRVEMTDLAEKGLIKTRLTDDDKTHFFPAHEPGSVYKFILSTLKENQLDSTDFQLLTERLDKLKKLISAEK